MLSLWQVRLGTLAPPTSAFQGEITYLTNDIQPAILEDAVTGQRESEYVLVPRVPTEKMLRAAADAALAEDAQWVWSSMIESFEGLTSQEGELRPR